MIEMSSAEYSHRPDEILPYGMKTASVLFDESNKIMYTSPNLWNTIDLDPAPDQINLHQLEEKFPSVSLNEYVTKVIRGEEHVLEEEIITTSGKYFLLAVCALKMQNGGQPSTGAIICLSDISPLQLSENKFRTLSDVLPQLIWTNDTKGD